MIKRVHLIEICWFGFGLLAAQGIAQAQFDIRQQQVERNPRFEHLTAADGLPSSTVPCLIQDRTGYLWFGTFRGLARYDGYTILSYKPRQGDSTSITNAIIEALCEDSEGNIWIGHARGLDKLNRATETFSHYVLNPQQPLTHWSNHVLAVHEDRNGVLWIGTGDGLCTFDRTTETFAWLRHDNTDPNSLGHNSVNGFYEGKDGSFWIATGGGLERFDRATNKFVHYWHVPNNAYQNPPTLGHWVLSIFEDREGILWLGTDGGVVEFNRQTETFTQYRHDPANPASLANNTVVSICEDRSGNLWISTKAGLDVLDRKTRRFSHHVHDSHAPAGLSSDAVGRIMLEQSGTLWISTDGSGVNKLVQSKSFLKHYSPAAGNLPSINIQSFAEDESGSLWLATDAGLMRFDPKEETFERHPPHGDVGPIIEDRAGNLWISGYPTGFYTRDRRGHVSRFRDPSGHKLDGWVSSMCNGRDGRIWLGTSLGKILLLHPASGELTFIGQFPTWIERIYEDSSGFVWVGTREIGLLCYDPSKKSFSQFTSDPHDPASLSSNSVYRICEDTARVLWVVAGGVLNKYERQTKTFTRLMEKDGFPSEVSHVLADTRGTLWISTPKGIVKFDPRTNRIKMLGDEAKWIFQTRNGEVYFVRRDGMTRVHPDSLHENSFIPPIVITSFRKFEKPTQFGREIRLSHTENFISFEFAALSYVSPEKNQYAYKLEGLDRDWVYCGTRRYAGYPHLEPGEYVFRVKGSNNDGVWNEEGTSVLVIITPPWWGTWWFRAIGFFALLGVVGGTIRYVEIARLRRRMRLLEQQQALERERIRISGDLHDELASNLTSIAMLSKILSDQKLPATERVDHSQLLDRITTLSSQSVESIRDIIWAIDPKDETLDSLLTRLRDMLVSLCRAKNIQLHFEQSPSAQLPSANLQPELRRNLWLLLKEGVNNALKHSGCTELVIDVRYSDPTLQIELKDNGKGFDVSAGTPGRGLRTMRMRAEQINGTLACASSPGKGTTISLAVKIENRTN